MGIWNPHLGTKWDIVPDVNRCENVSLDVI